MRKINTSFCRSMQNRRPTAINVRISFIVSFKATLTTLATVDSDITHICTAPLSKIAMTMKLTVEHIVLDIIWPVVVSGVSILITQEKSEKTSPDVTPSVRIPRHVSPTFLRPTIIRKAQKARISPPTSTICPHRTSRIVETLGKAE